MFTTKLLHRGNGGVLNVTDVANKSFPFVLLRLLVRSDYIIILSDVECFGVTDPYSGVPDSRCTFLIAEASAQD